MEYLVACNWDFELINKIDYPEVSSVFAGLPDTIISSGRPSQQIRCISEPDIRKTIKLVHEKKWSFDFNVNSSCLANRELTSAGFKAIMKYLEWLVDLGVDAVTVANTNLIAMVKKNFPMLRVNVSTFQKIAEVTQAQRFEDLGVDLIMLSEHVNRDFKVLRAIRKAVKCKLALIGNVGCVYDCPNAHTHANSLAHTGARGEQSVLPDACMLYCFSKRLEKPEELVKIRFIRPEDVSYYEELGIDVLKIIDRSSTTDVLAERVKAYSERSYDGNLLELLGQMMDSKRSISRAKEIVIKNMLKKPIPSSFRAGKNSRDFIGLFEHSLYDLVSLDNKRLPNGFIKGYEQRDCRATNCETCGNCKTLAAESVRILDEALLDATLAKTRQGLEDIRGGTLLG